MLDQLLIVHKAYTLSVSGKKLYDRQLHGPNNNLRSWSEQKPNKKQLYLNSKFYVVKTVVAIFRKYENKSKKLNTKLRGQ